EDGIGEAGRLALGLGGELQAPAVAGDDHGIQVRGLGRRRRLLWIGTGRRRVGLQGLLGHRATGCTEQRQAQRSRQRLSRELDVHRTPLPFLVWPARDGVAVEARRKAPRARRAGAAPALPEAAGW